MVHHGSIQHVDENIQHGHNHRNNRFMAIIKAICNHELTENWACCQQHYDADLGGT